MIKRYLKYPGSPRQTRILVGVEVGEHTEDYREVINEMNKAVQLKLGNFILIRGKARKIPYACLVQWAKFCKAYHIYFTIVYSHFWGIESLTGKRVRLLKKLAGKYYVGDTLGEMGGVVSVFQAYDLIINRANIPDFSDLQQAKEWFVTRVVKPKVDRGKRLGINNIMCVEATAFHRYNCAGGVNTPLTELLVGDPEIMLASVRGTARAYRRRTWGSHIAIEWYGGYRHDDLLKAKRLQLGLYASFIAGAHYIYPESGLFSIHSYGRHYGFNSKYCRTNRKIHQDFYRFISTHPRPVIGPLVKVGVIQGKLDGWTGWGCATLWGQFHKDKWQYADPERSWKYLDNLGRSQPWSSPFLVGSEDRSGTIPYGQYDIVPLEAPVGVLRQYSCLIFLGWNTMDRNSYEKLKDYTKAGGHLIMAVPHLNIETRREAEMLVINNGDVSDLFGCIIRGKGQPVNAGMRFVAGSTIPAYQFPVMPKGTFIDPICAAGRITLADIILKSARKLVQIADDPGGGALPYADQYTTKDTAPILIENKIGKGVALLITAWEYPGCNGLNAFMELLLNTILTGEQGDIRVIGNDRVKYAIYQDKSAPVGTTTTTVYLLNTNFNVPAYCQVHLKQLIFPLKIEACSLRIVIWQHHLAMSVPGNSLHIKCLYNNQATIIGRGRRNIELAALDPIKRVWLNNQALHFDRTNDGLYQIQHYFHANRNHLKVELG